MNTDNMELFKRQDLLMDVRDALQKANEALHDADGLIGASLDDPEDPIAEDLLAHLRCALSLVTEALVSAAKYYFSGQGTHHGS